MWQLVSTDTRSLNLNDAIIKIDENHRSYSTTKPYIDL